MFSNRNDYYSQRLSHDDFTDEYSGANSFSEENLSSEDDFRGFEKIPVVRLERFDFSQYLNNGVHRKENLQLEKDAAEKSCSVVSKFLQECVVKLVRDDLEQLKETYRTNVLLNKELAQDNDTKLILKCKICQKAYSSEKKLQNHQENKHLLVYKPQAKTPKRVSFSDYVIIHEVKEYHRCRKCPKIFENYTALKVHMKRKHKKRKCYICNYCSKNFVDRMFFKVHIKLHCDVCGQLLLNKQDLMEHRRNICNVVKKYTCKTCDESYFSFMNLKDHSYDHLGTFFICDICKDQFQGKCEVAHHIQFLHTTQRPQDMYEIRNLGSETLYTCRFCNTSSEERDVIENHVSTLPDLTNKVMTGYDDFYFCDQCLKKFPNETDMLKHKWSHFLNSTDNSQERPMPNSKKTKQTYNASEKIPEYMQPQLVLEKIKIGGRVVSEPIKFVKVQNVDIQNGEIKKPVIDPVSKKTIISKHQCSTCHKYFSSNYCLNRHILKVHKKFDNLQCHRCEETFVWPSLLLSHNCICNDIPEMAFDDARPETQIDNIESQDCLDDLMVSDESYMNSLDYEMPSPICELTEYENVRIVLNYDNCVASPKLCVNPLPDYNVVMQEVPIEF
ncbi:zinc finger protein 271-like isoform X1 [Zerene cesonia]|uniref:zinc finger protein 271-like isoform X1 n=1 Tax=Zerene cesonia TaxID=33412 RepID=UPI0018E5227B|nr:zinc finger protein 271-like isoform X1 [Zerene cesonia]